MSQMHPVLRKWLIIFSVLCLVGVAAAGLSLGALLAYIDNLPPLDVLENYRPPEITRVTDRTGNNQIAEFVTGSERRELVHFEDVPEHLVNAFIAIEDERYYSHFGVDLEGIGRAIVENFKAGGKSQGASTITMQVARNVVLLDKRKKLSRKIREILTSMQIERNYSKKQILEFYMNQIFFGSQSYGVQAAARTYFNKDVKDLTVPEGAMIAGLPKAPTQLSPLKDPEKARDRRNLVLRNMRKLGYIKTDEELERYINTPIELNQAPRAQTQSPYFVDYVRSYFAKEAAADPGADISGKGYTVVSTVDLNLQRILEEELSKGLREVEKEIEEQKSERFGSESSHLGDVARKQARLARIDEVRDDSISVSLRGYKATIPLPKNPPYFNPQNVIKKGNLIDIYIADIKGNKLEAYLFDKTHVQGGAVLLDVHTGEILAIAGGDDFYDATNNGQWNRAVQGGRQPGSCWKPLLYGASFDVMDKSGFPKFTPGYVEVDEPYSIGGYSPKNYEGRHFGPTALYEGLVKSRNIPTIKLFMDIGPKTATALYNKFNVVTIPSDWQLDPVPSMCLGTPNITPLELAAAYAVFPNGGIGITPTPIKRMFNPKNTGDSRSVKPVQSKILSPEAAYMTVKIMSDVVAMGTAKTTIGKWIMEQTAKGRKLPQIAGKTGTTNDCFVAWFCGYTPDLVLAIYVGYDQHRSMGPKMVGGRTIGPIWVPMMDRILQTRSDWKMKFDIPPGVDLCDICGKSGKRVTDACYASGDAVYKNAAFKRGTAPTESCGYHGYGYSSGGESGDVEGGYVTGQDAVIGNPGTGGSGGGFWN
ncbi:MAG: PBP1A family penicillin-binding protein [Candidatus Sumerlaeaceae bacterium]|nr:PBP1A family penicillin-binding protein [Candidatus Sumerlaeaceae bacterium]